MGRLLNHFESCQVRKVTSLLTEALRIEVPGMVERFMIPKLPLNWFGYTDAAIADAAIKGAYHSDRDCVLVLPPTSDQSFASGPSLVFSVSEREQLPAFALKEGAGGAPDRLRTTEHHLLAALLADKDNLP
jgi:hypothetical protein